MRGHIDKQVVQGLALDGGGREVPASHMIFDAAARRGDLAVLVSGVAGETRSLPDGRRQIVALRLPGDALAPQDSERLVALTQAKVAEGDRLVACLTDGSADYQPLRLAWVAAGLTDQAILRDQVVRLGRMSAFERTAHFLLEAHERLAQVGLAGENAFHLPLTQETVSDVLGLSVVHLNRTLQSLRREGLVTSKQGYVTLSDRNRLVHIAGYVSRFPLPWRPDTSLPARRAPQRDLALAS